MTAAILRDAVAKRIASAREQHIQALRQCKYHPAVGIDKGILPASGVEAIALFANQTNAWIESLDALTVILDDEFRRLSQPERPDTEQRKTKEMY